MQPEKWARSGYMKQAPILPENKICSRCREEKPQHHFNKRPANKDGLRSYCKLCHRAEALKYARDNRPKRLKWKIAYQMRKLHGLSPAEHRAFIAEHGGRCYVCHATETLCIDHDHATGRKRGVLCKRCNMALGYLKDDLRRAYGLIDYIAKKCGQ